MNPINLDDLYAVLAPIARNQGQMTYSDLSQAYYTRTHDWHEPHGSWDAPLGLLNRTLNTIRWPPLSAVVVNGETREPGPGFWEDSPNVPARPTNDIDRIAVYSRLLRQVHAAPWPPTMPLAPPALIEGWPKAGRGRNSKGREARKLPALAHCPTGCRQAPTSSACRAAATAVRTAALISSTFSWLSAMECFSMTTTLNGGCAWAAQRMTAGTSCLGRRCFSGPHRR